MRIITPYFVFIIFVVFSISVKADSSTEFTSSDQFKNNYLQNFSGSIRTQYIRNIRVSNDQFLTANKKNGLLDTLYIKNDLTVIYPINFLDNNTIFKNTKGILALIYNRVVYATAEEIRGQCWLSYICFQDIYLGLFTPITLLDTLPSVASLYFIFPFSRNSFNTSFILGVGGYVKITYQMFSNKHIKVFLSFKKDLQIRSFFYQTANEIKTIYNAPLLASYNLSLGFKHLKYVFVPILSFDSGYRFLLDFNGDYFHHVSLDILASWSISKNLNIIMGIIWQEKIFTPHHSLLPLKTEVFNPDHSFFNLGGSYTF